MASMRKEGTAAATPRKNNFRNVPADPLPKDPERRIINNTGRTGRYAAISKTVKFMIPLTPPRGGFLLSADFTRHCSRRVDGVDSISIAKRSDLNPSGLSTALSPRITGFTILFTG